MELHLEGWLVLDQDDNLALSPEKNKYLFGEECIAETIMRNFRDYTYAALIHQDSLGDKRTYIPNANLACWFSDEKNILEEAQMGFDRYMEIGDIKTYGHYVGYSEYTITGFDVDEFTIGGHDLNAEFKFHIGQYLHLVLTN